MPHLYIWNASRPHMPGCRYGHLGELTQEQWGAHLTSDKGLFKLLYPTEIEEILVGPHLAPGGECRGDTLMTESLVFSRRASRDQCDFYYDELLDDNPVAGKEYILTLTGYRKKWEEDMQYIQAGIAYEENFDKELTHILSVNDEQQIVLCRERLHSLVIPLTVCVCHPMKILSMSLTVWTMPLLL